jgi:hypothetical protein
MLDCRSPHIQAIAQALLVTFLVIHVVGADPDRPSGHPRLALCRAPVHTGLPMPFAIRGLLRKRPSLTKL